MRLNRSFPIIIDQLYFQPDRPITFLHVHDCLELGYCFSGRGVFLVGEKVLPYQAGDMVFINQTEAHLARSAPGTNSEWSWVYCDPIRLVGHREENMSDLDPSPFRGADFPNIMNASAHPAQVRIVLRIIEEFRENAPGKESAIRALVWELMTLMQREKKSTQEFGLTARQEYARLAPALQMMASNYTQPLLASSLARSCGLSEVHFRRLFLRTIGCSPRAYWNSLRIRMAASLLRGTTRSIQEIGLDVGFETLSSFNRLFLAHFKVSPRKWRNGLESGGL